MSEDQKDLSNVDEKVDNTESETTVNIEGESQPHNLSIEAYGMFAFAVIVIIFILKALYNGNINIPNVDMKDMVDGIGTDVKSIVNSVEDPNTGSEWHLIDRMFDEER